MDTGPDNANRESPDKIFGDARGIVCHQRRGSSVRKMLQRLPLLDLTKKSRSQLCEEESYGRRQKGDARPPRTIRRRGGREKAKRNDRSKKAARCARFACIGTAGRHFGVTAGNHWFSDRSLPIGFSWGSARAAGRGHPRPYVPKSYQPSRSRRTWVGGVSIARLLSTGPESRS